ncbi:hypothetical protein SCAR479_08732 [Seiridium cardinale]|uniref:Ubiquitin-like domain-containing protein n=1 Tax=Seiridium cardinale TaxID=138064 RepID=A0ABR2XLL8_9PEZI
MVRLVVCPVPPRPSMTIQCTFRKLPHWQEYWLNYRWLQGCCFSQPAGPNAPHPGGAPAGSTGAINSPRLQPATTEGNSARSAAVTQTSRPHPRTSSSEASRRRREQRPLDQHIDKPLRWHVWHSKNRIWTRAQLDKEREDFFDTRVTGRPEVWQTIHAALRELWDADTSRRVAAKVDGDATQDDPALGIAQGILRAAEVTLPTGDMANGVYDSLGQYYTLPEWIVRDPVNVATVGNQAKVEVDRKCDLASGGESSEEVDADEALRRREEKGKAVVDPKTTTKIRIRISETARDIIVRVSPDESVRSVGQKALQQSGLDPSTRRIRLFYLGKPLKDDASLASQGHNKDHIINAFTNTR